MSTSRHILPVVFYLLLAFACSVFYGACRKAAPPEPYVRSIELEAVDASCTEAWLKVSLTDSNEPRTIVLKRNDSLTVVDFRLLTSDTLVVDEGLLPNRTYRYKAYRFTPTSSGLADSRVPAEAGLIDSSTQVTLTTLDSTSHSFQFSIDSLGVTSSVLYDVAIISEDNIWAVGELYLNDSSGQLDPILYNLAVWNGQSWNIQRILIPICPSGTGYAPLRAIFAFGENDIWITDGGKMIHWDGQTFRGDCSVNPLLQGGLNKIWGNGFSIYAVGNSGTIVYSPDHGSTWRRVESGTTLPIWDIFGSRDETTREYEVICVASNHSFPEGRKLLRIQGSSVTALPDSGLPWSIDAIWHVPGRKYIVVGDSVWQVNQLGTVWKSIRGLPNLYTTSIAGSALNDIIIGGAFWNLLHFNGLTLRPYFPRASGSFVSVAIMRNMIVAVGGAGSRAIVVRGAR